MQSINQTLIIDSAFNDVAKIEIKRSRKFLLSIDVTLELIKNCYKLLTQTTYLANQYINCPWKIKKLINVEHLPFDQKFVLLCIQARYIIMKCLYVLYVMRLFDFMLTIHALTSAVYNMYLRFTQWLWQAHLNDILPKNKD